MGAFEDAAQLDSDRAFRLEALRVATGGQPVRSAQAASVALVIADHFADFVLHGTLPEFERDEVKVAAPEATKASTGDWWWTRHGWAVADVTPTGAKWTGPVARCGGPSGCAQCASDAARMRAGLLPAEPRCTCAAPGRGDIVGHTRLCALRAPVDGSTAQAFPQQG